MSRFWPRFLRTFGWVISVAVLLTFLALAGLHLDWTKRWTLAQAQQAAQKSGLILAADRLSYNLIRGSVELHGASLAAEGRSPAFVKAERVALTWKYSAWRSGLSAVQEIRAEGVAVAIRSGPDGRLNLPESSGSTEPLRGMPANVVLERIALSYDDGKTRISLPMVQASLHDGKWNAGLIAPGALTVPDLTATLNRLHIVGRLERLALDALSAQGSLSVMNVKAPDLAPLAAETAFSFDGKSMRLELANTRAASKEGTFDASGSVSFRDESSSAKVAGEFLGVRANGEATWTGVNFGTVQGEGQIVSRRKDVRGGGRFRFDANAVDVSIAEMAAMGVIARGAVRMRLPSQQLSGVLTGEAPSLEDALGEQLSGRAFFTATVGGTARHPRVGIDLNSTNLSMGPLQGATAAVRAAYAANKIIVEDAALIWNGQTVHASGTATLQGKDAALALEVEAVGVSIDRILDELDIGLPVGGTASAKVSVRGMASKPELSAVIDGERLIAWGERFGGLQARVSLAGSRLELTELQIAKPQELGPGELMARGWLDLDARTYEAEVESKNLHLESLRLRNGNPIHAAIAISGVGKGSLDEPMGSLSLKVDSPEAGSLSTVVEVVGENIRFSAESNGVRFDDFGVPGSTKLAVRGDGKWRDLKGVRAEATLADLKIAVADQEITTQGPVELQLRAGQLAVHRAVIRSEGATATLTGALPVWEDSSSSLRVEGTAPFALVSRHIPSGLGVQLGGNAAVKGTIGGTVLKPIPDISLTTEDATIQVERLQQQFDSVKATAQINGDRLELKQLSANLGSGKISGTAEIPFRDGEVRLNLDIAKIDPAAALLPAPAKLASLVSAHVQAVSPSFEIEDIVGAVRITELQVKTAAGSAALVEDATLSLNKGRLELTRLRLKNETDFFESSGWVELTGRQAIEVKVDGQMEADILSKTSTDYGLTGAVDAHLAVSGTIPEPQIRGTAEMKNGRLLISSPFPLAGDKIDLLVRFDGRTVNIERAGGSVNGGKIAAEGTLTWANGTIDTANLKLHGTSVFLEYPKGFQTASNLDLTLTNQGRTLVLGGTASLLDGSYREAVNLTNLATSKLRNISVVDGEPSELMSRLRLNIGFDTLQPVIFDNNLGRVTADADLRLTGTLSRPAITGRFEVEEGSRIYFNGRTFVVNQGVVDFTDETRIAPRFNLEAVTTVSNYEVTLKLTGDVDKTETTFTSEPSLNEDQILALLFTGNKDNAGKGTVYAQTQMLALFGGGITGGITNRLRNTFGLSELRIDPGLVSADQNPIARLTIGQNFTPEFRITYSTNLTDSQDQIWTAEYDWRRRFLARFFRETNQNNRLELRQKFRFGGGPQTGDFTRRERSKLNVGDLSFEGERVYEDATILKQLKLKTGRKYDFLKAQKGLERLKAFYAKNGYAEVRIQQDRQTHDGVIDLEYTINAGQPVKFVFEGVSPSSSLRKKTARTWQQGIIDAQRLGTTSKLIEQYYILKGYPDTKVQAELKGSGNVKTAVFEVDRGVHYGRPSLFFPGVSKSTASELSFFLRGTKLDMQAKSNSDTVVQALTTRLRNEGYLAAKVSPPRIKSDGTKLSVEFSIDPGLEYKLGEVSFEGTKLLTEQNLRRSIIILPGDKYVPDDPFKVAQMVQQAYWDAGYRNAEVEPKETLDTAAGRANLLLKVTEGQRFSVANIHLEGLSETSEAYLRKRLTLEEGDVLSAKKINDSRKNLLDSGAYNLLDFTYPEVAGAAPDGSVQPVDLMIKVREPKPFRIDVGGTYDTDRGPGVIADISTLNTLGEARTLGFRTTADRLKQDYRSYFTQPFFGKRRINTTATLFYTHQIDSPYDTDDVGATLQQNVRFRNRWNFSYGYQMEWARVTLPEVISLRGWTSALVSSLAYDSRDMVLDATKGVFLSSAIEYGPPVLGGSIDYYRTYLQLAKYFGLTKPRIMPFEERRRSRVVFATSTRLGFADTLGDTFLLPIDRFFAGGGTTIRGYEQNSVGPKLPNGSPAGGSATLLLNNELRFPLYKFVDGVAFVDAGNVWPLPSGFKVSDLRVGSGFGVRIRNPFVILRFDYGWKVGRQPGESAGAFFFSIGQAF